MNNKRMRFGFLVLSIYAALGVIGVSSRESATNGVLIVANTQGATTSPAASSEGGGAEVSVQWHSFLPGAFK